MLPRASLAIAVSFMIACGGGSLAPTPTSPTPPAPSSNQSPQILSATASPSLGVQDLTTFTAHVEARDPDADPLSVSWSSPLLGTVGTNADLSFKSNVGSPLTVTVTDSKGASASAKVHVVVADLNWYYDGYFGNDGHGFDFSMHLTRTGTIVTGTFTDYTDHRHQGIVDPAGPGQIDAEGRFRIRFKLGSVGDFTLVGQLVPHDQPFPDQFFSNWRGTGFVTGGQFDGRSFTFGEHNSY